MSDSTYEGWVVVFESGTDYEADLVRGRLDDAGFPAIVFNQRDHAFNVNFGDLAQVHVLVQPEHVEASTQLLAATPSSDERGRDHRYDRASNACVIGGLVLHILGGSLLSARALVLGTVLLIIGLGFVAKRKGRDWKWGFMGLFSGFGLLIVAALRDRLPDENQDEELAQAAMAATLSPSAHDTETQALLDSGSEMIFLWVPEDEEETLFEEGGGMEEPGQILPEGVDCPFCEADLELSPLERIEKRFTCPDCNQELDFTESHDTSIHADLSEKFQRKITQKSDRELYDILAQLEEYTSPFLKLVVAEMYSRGLDPTQLICPSCNHVIPGDVERCPICEAPVSLSTQVTSGRQLLDGVLLVLLVFYVCYYLCYILIR